MGAFPSGCRSAGAARGGMVTWIAGEVYDGGCTGTTDETPVSHWPRGESVHALPSSPRKIFVVIALITANPNDMRVISNALSDNNWNNTIFLCLPY